MNRTFDRPAFRPGLYPTVVEDDQVFLLTESRQFILIGRAYGALAPLLDGRLEMGPLVERAGETVPLPEAMYAVEQLIRKGYVIDAAKGSGDRGHGAWLEAIDAPNAPIAHGVRVEVLGVDEQPFLRAFERAGLASAPGISANGDNALRVVAVADYLDERLNVVAEEQAARAAPWMPVSAAGPVTWFGPIVRPGRSVCWSCLTSAIRRNRQVERYVKANGGRMIRAGLEEKSGPSAELAAARAALIAERWAHTGVPPETFIDTLHTFDMRDGTSATHAVVAEDGCERCGAESSPDAPFALAPAPKRFTGDGGHRTCPPAETWDRLSRHVSPITGIVSSLVRKEPDTNGRTFSYASGHDFVVDGPDLSKLRANLRFRSGGKGMTDLQARVSAVSEALERWSGIWTGREPVRRAPYDQVAELAVHPEALLGFSEGQYAGRAEWNRTCSSTHFHVVPHRLDPSLPIDWVEAHDLTRGGSRLVPAANAYYGHPDASHFFCTTDANGTSAGNTVEEAILQGFLELVERDAVALWWYNRLRRPALDLASFGDPWVLDMVDHYRSIGRELHVLDLTHDLGIPVYAGISRSVERPTEDILASFGAHFDPGIALTRAISEVNQFLPAVEPRNADGTTRYAYDDPDAIAWWSRATLASEPYLTPDETVAPTRRDAVLYTATDDLRDDVEACIDIARRAGLEVLVLDQSRAGADLKVVRVMVPGLRHFWRRLGPGRLYDTPVKLGWLDAPRAEHELNHLSIFF
jgi:oxazoline/thiazoline synthase